MSAETADLRTKTRRVKDHILSRFLTLAEKVDAETPLERSERELYQELMMTFARNVLPRSQEIGGDPDNRTPIPILSHVPTDNGNQKDKPASQTDSSGTGGNVS